MWVPRPSHCQVYVFGTRIRRLCSLPSCLGPEFDVPRLMTKLYLVSIEMLIYQARPFFVSFFFAFCSNIFTHPRASSCVMSARRSLFSVIFNTN
jgi:hypothetical protein